MTDDGKRLGTFRLSDGFLILLFLLCGMGVILRAWNFRGEPAGRPENYTITVECRWLDARTADCLRESDLLYTETGEYFGRVERIVRTPAKAEITENGVLYAGELPQTGRCDLKAEILIEGKISGGVLLRNGTSAIAVGETYRLYTDRTSFPYRVLFCATKPVG